MKKGYCLKAKIKCHRLKKNWKRINCGERLILILISAFTLILIASFIAFIIKLPWNISTEMDDWGNYSMCLGAIISFVSVILIYITYRKQAESYNEQAKSAYKMQFDSTFFKLLDIQRQIHFECINKVIEYKESESSKKEFKSVFSFMKYRITCELKSRLNNDTTEFKESEAIEKISSIYTCVTKFDDKFSPDGIMQETHEENDIMHYFRNLYHVIKHVNDSSLSSEEKRKYIDLIQAQMNDEELLAMLFNVVHYTANNTNKLYFSLLDDYTFFENLRPPHNKAYFLIKPLFKKSNLKYIKQPKSN